MSEKADPQVIAARKKLEELEVDPLCADIILTSDTVEDVGNQCAAQHLGAGPTQLLYYPFNALFVRDEAIRTRATQELAPLLEGLLLPDDFVHKYFTEFSDVPGQLFAIHHGDIPYEHRQPIDQAANELMLKELKRHLET